MNPEPQLEILYRDNRICAVAKPSGLMVHRTGISADTVFLVDRLRDQLGQRIWTVHRLDRATSGVLLFALDVDAAGALGRQFEAGSIAKRYLAVVRGWLDESGTIDRPLRTPRGREQAARTHYRRLARTELEVPVHPHPTARYSLAGLAPETGRMHQLRRHLNGIAHPVVGDVNHGDRRHNRLFRSRFSCHRLMLHALSIEFAHPDSSDNRRQLVTAPPPEGFSRVVDELGWSEPMARAVHTPMPTD